MQRLSVKNLAMNLVRPGYLPVIAEKCWRRIADYHRRTEASIAERWCAENAQPLEPFLAGLDAELWSETLTFERHMRQVAQAKLDALGIDLGGGGDYRLLYFLTRYRRPEVVVETGVAAGFSSQAVLSALARNGSGHLYSSDFPYFRLAQPERYVGYLVDEELKGPWSLFLEGDRKNLPSIGRQISHVDLLHYDSDKSVAGRQLPLELLRDRLDDNTMIIFDDIQDNLFFRDYSKSIARECRVFHFHGKYLGLIGL